MIKLKKYSDSEEIINRLCEFNVREQVINVGNTTVVQEAWKRRQPLSIHGWIYDVGDGLLIDRISGISLNADLDKLMEEQL